VEKGKKYLVVSVHDVTPAFGSEIKEIVDELKIQKIDKKSILVIPNYLGRYNILKNYRFLNRLNVLKEEGNEIVLHGYEHISRNKKYSSFYGYLMGEWIAQGCAEFQNISYGEAEDKIRRGREILNCAGLICTGFVAPGWLMSKEANKAVIDEGFEYTTFVKIFRNYQDNIDIKSEVFRFVPQIRTISYLKKLYNHYLWKENFVNKKLARVAIHPQDLRIKRAFEYLLKIINRLREGRIIVTYLDFLKRQKTFKGKEFDAKQSL